MDVPVPRFDKNMEEFYSICDQIELHLVSDRPPRTTTVICLGSRYFYISRTCDICCFLWHFVLWEDLVMCTSPCAGASYTDRFFVVSLGVFR